MGLQIQNWIRASKFNWALLIIPFAVFILMATILGDWIIDDAGISYTYARNVAAGHGFVSQPGLEPVEGFSNFLWVILLAPFFSLGIFGPVVFVKWFSAFLVLIGFFVIQKAFLKVFSNQMVGFFGTMLLAVSPPIVIWSMSGLENSLTILLSTLLMSELILKGPEWLIRGGLLVALLGMNHPEGALFFAAVPAVLIFDSIAEKQPLGKLAKETLIFIASFSVAFGSFIAFRLTTFGLIFPHTYYAKKSYDNLVVALSDKFLNPAQTFSRLVELFKGIAGPAGVYIVLICLLLFIYLLIKKRISQPIRVLVILSLISIFSYLWLDPDWMGEFRFGTTSTLFTLLSTTALTYTFFATIKNRYIKICLVVVCIAFSILLLSDFYTRIHRFSKNPPTPFGDVADKWAFKFDRYADILGIENGSMFLPDVGAPLYYSRLRVHDAAGLCEPGVIKTLKKSTIYWCFEHEEFYDYIFDIVKPSFINTHGFWTYVTAFEKDPRFSRDYVAITEYEDLVVRDYYGQHLHSGDYVRRELLRDEGDLDRLRLGYQPRKHPAEMIFEPYPKAEYPVDVTGKNEAARSPDNTVLIDENAKKYLLEGLTFGNAGKHELALEAYRKAIEIQPDYIDAFNNLGWTYGQLGRFDEAEEALLKALSLKPDHELAQGNLRWVRSQRKVEPHEKE